MNKGDRGSMPVDRVVTSVTYVIAILSFLAVYPYIEPGYAIIFPVLFSVALYYEYRKRFLPRVLLTILSLVIVGIYFYGFTLNDLAVKTVEALLMLLCTKLLEKKRFRDYMQVYLISIFLLVGAALLGVTMLFLVYLVTLVFLLNAAIVLLVYYVEDPEVTIAPRAVLKIVTKATLIPFLAVPVAAFIFFLTPRTPYPFLNFLNQGNKGVTGFSDKISLGNVSAIQEDGSIIFRAAMDRVAEPTLYWRGIVLDRFDGATWSAHDKRSEPFSGPIRVLPTGPEVRQEIYIEPYGNTYLFVLDKPVQVFLRGVRAFSDLTFSYRGIIDRKTKYQAFSNLSDTLPEAGVNAKKYLQLPADLSPRIKGLAGRLAVHKTPEETIDSIRRFLGGSEYSYSLSGLPVSDTPLEDFLFVRKMGNCEYFASALAVLARAAGVPSRLVAGYHGGYYNELGRYYLVAQKHAHVWTEVHLAGRGWVRYDPTPAAGKAVSPFRDDALMKMRVYLDMFNYYWIVFVVNYDVQKQYSLYEKAMTAVGTGGLRLRSFGERKYLLFVLLFLGLAFAAAGLASYRRRSVVERVISAFLRKLGKQGYRKGPSLGLEEFVDGIDVDSLREQARQFVRGFEETYYRDRPFTREDVKRLKGQIKELGRQRRS